MRGQRHRDRVFPKVGRRKVRLDRAMRQAGTASKRVIEGVLFHQDESNNGDRSWPGRVTAQVTDLRNDLGLEDDPLLAGELLYSGSYTGHNTLVRQLPSTITNAFVIPANGHTVDTSATTYNLHFNHDSQVKFGKTCGDQMKKALGL